MTSTNRNETQFQAYRDWQWVKHVTLRKYAAPWSVILGSRADQLYVVDGCAGAGVYTDPDTNEEIADGSPVIIARRAQEYSRERGPRKSMHVICVEPNRRNFEQLTACTARYKPHVTRSSSPPSAGTVSLRALASPGSTSV